ncbi:MAG: hypothetical protein OWT28_03525 [Firmicutes bacterium]|nr:hypothetical protein [Bacillota bacterium]
MRDGRAWRVFTTPMWILYALWAMLFYQLVFTAWTIEYSVFGVIGVVVASLLFIYAFPRADRRTLIRFTIFSLAVSLGIPTFASQPMGWRIVDYIVFVAFALFLGRWLIKMRLSRLLLVVLFITAAEVWVPLDDMSMLSKFQIEYTGHLGSQDPQIPSIPVATVANPTNASLQEIITLQAHRPIEGEAQKLIDLMAGPVNYTAVQSAIDKLQHTYDVVGVTPGRLFFHVTYPGRSLLRQLPFSDLEMVDFPFTTANILTLFDRTRMYLSLSENPGDLLSTVMNPGRMADSIASLSVQTARAEKANWDAVTGRPTVAPGPLKLANGYLTGTYDGETVRVKNAGDVLLGIYRLLPTSMMKSPQAVIEGNNRLQVVSLPPDRPRVVATLHGTYLNPLTTDIVFADITGSGTDQLLLNTVPAQIVGLTPQLTWQTMWVSARSSFRFETAFSQPGGDLLIANSPGYDNNTPTRYLGGYKYSNGQLLSVFRSYHGDLVSLHTVHVTSAKTPELLTSVYSNQEIMLLKPTVIPWQSLVEGLYVLMLMIGLARRSRKGGRLL